MAIFCARIATSVHLKKVGNNMSREVYTKHWRDIGGERRWFKLFAFVQAIVVVYFYEVLLWVSQDRRGNMFNEKIKLEFVLNNQCDKNIEDRFQGIFGGKLSIVFITRDLFSTWDQKFWTRHWQGMDINDKT